MAPKSQGGHPARAVVICAPTSACKGNPGAGRPGARWLSAGGHERELCGGDLGPTTNNRMELTAAIEALEALTRPVTVHLHTDSIYVRDGIPSGCRAGSATAG